MKRLRRLYRQLLIWLGAAPPEAGSSQGQAEQAASNTTAPDKRRRRGRRWSPVIYGLLAMILCGAATLLVAGPFPIFFLSPPIEATPSVQVTPSPDLTQAVLAAINLDGVDLREQNLPNKDLSNASLRGTDLSGVNLRDTLLINANLTRANLSQADLGGANLSGADLTGADLSQANLSRATLNDTTLDGANLNNANLSEANLQDANLSNANLSNANLPRSTFRDVNLTNALLSQAFMVEADLSGVDLGRTASLSGADLRGANLTEADLRGADLSGADLSGLDLSYKDLDQADLRGANLSGTNLTGVDLEQANFSNANLEDAVFTTTVAAYLPPLAIEKVVGAETGPGDPVGLLQLEYETLMTPGSSGQIRVSLTSIPNFAEEYGDYTEAEFTPGEFYDNSDQGTFVFIRDRVSVNLKGPDKFKIKRILPDDSLPGDQALNLQEEQVAAWLWSIDTPTVTGDNYLFVEINRDGIDQPWLQSFKITLEAPTPPARLAPPLSGPGSPTPIVTATPTPLVTPSPAPTFTPDPGPESTPEPTTLERVRDQFVEGVVDIVKLVLPMIVGGIVFIFQNQRTRRKEIKELRRQLANATTDRKIIEQEIEALRAAKWWQFWK